MTERENKEGVRGTTKDPCLLYLNVCFLDFVNKIIWIRKVSIFISWFLSDQHDSQSRFAAFSISI